MATELYQQVWAGYARARDSGHLDFIEMAERCERYFRGEQWEQTTLEALGDRPALTVNMVLATMATAFGQMLENYTETSFYTKDPRLSDMNAVLKQVFRHIYNENRLRWVDMEVAMDGFITGRGFFDVRMCFRENLQGDVVVTQLDPRDVLIDPDARSYLPTEWKEVYTTRWLTLDEIGVIYGDKYKRRIQDQPLTEFAETFDVVQTYRVPHTFSSGKGMAAYVPVEDDSDVAPRRYRVIERQYKKLRTSEYFLDMETGETRPVPDTWDEERILRVMETAASAGAELRIIRRREEAIRITVVAANQVLYDDWSPYKHFTVVPYFPYFRWGKAMGVVENILDLQDATNKVLSQTLHVINTTANSGWIVKAGTLVNMTLEELEERAAETGLVIEVSDLAGLEKIAPNQVPTGLDRMTDQLSNWVKYVSGISDAMRGFDRADVAAKAIVAKQQAGAISLAIPFENLNRTRHYLAEVILGMVQRFYTEPRVMRVAPDALNGQSETVAVNQPDPRTGRWLNDLTVGEYSVVVKTSPPQEKTKELQYQRAVELRSAGVPLPDWVLLEASGLDNLERIMKDMQAQAEAAKPARDKAEAADDAEIAKTRAEARAKAAEAALLEARVAEVQAQIQGTHPQQLLEADKAVRDREKLASETEFKYSQLMANVLKEVGRNDTATSASTGSGTPGPARSGTPGPARSGTPGPTGSGTPGPAGSGPGPAGSGTPGPAGSGPGPGGLPF